MTQPNALRHVYFRNESLNFFCLALNKMLRQWRNDIVRSEKTSARNLTERRRFNRAATWHNDVTRHLSSPLRGGAKKIFKALCNHMVGFFDGTENSPWHGGSVDEETEPIVPTLKAIAKTEVMITINGQPGVCEYYPQGSIRDDFVTQLTTIRYKDDSYELTFGDKSPAQVGDWVVFDSKNTKATITRVEGNTVVVNQYSYYANEQGNGPYAGKEKPPVHDLTLDSVTIREMGLYQEQRAYTSAMIKTELVDAFFEELQRLSGGLSCGIRVDYDTREQTFLGDFKTFADMKHPEFGDGVNATCYIQKTGQRTKPLTVWSGSDHFRNFNNVEQDYDMSGVSCVTIVDTRWCRTEQVNHILAAIQAVTTKKKKRKRTQQRGSRKKKK